MTLGYFVTKTISLWEQAAKDPKMEGVRFDIAIEILERTYAVDEMLEDPIEAIKQRGAKLLAQQGQESEPTEEEQK